MRALAAVLIVCAACCPAEQDELIPVVVRVDHGAEREPCVRVARHVPQSTDPCDVPSPDIATCTPVADVRVGDILTGADCYLDAKVRGGQTGRVMQCGATGAMVIFDGATFTGVMSNGYVDVCKTSRYDFPQGDNCTWATEQRIHGSLAGALGYSYSESPVSGQSCTLACRATAKLTSGGAGE